MWIIKYIKQSEEYLLVSLSFDNRDGYVWHNGNLVEWKDASVHVLNHGLHYASCVFEGERAYQGRIFESEKHTDRLFISAQSLDMKIPFTKKEILEAKDILLKQNSLSDAYVRPVVWRGSEMMAVSAQSTKINVAIAVWEWPSYFDPDQKMQGIKLDIAKWRRPSPECGPVHAKAAGLYMICTLSKHEAESKGYNDALMLDYRGQIAEATGANIFFKMPDGKLHTPLADCFLDGITRRTVMKIAQDHGIEIVERKIMPEEMANAEECFLTGTAAEVTPVQSIGNYRFIPGEVCSLLTKAYSELVNNNN
jgi:branched-chain amino acid aminotransferase